MAMDPKLQGTLTGAASGATAGAPLGPWGAAAGGLIGGAVGYFTAPDPNDPTKMIQVPKTAEYQREYLKQYLQRQAPKLDAYQSDRARGQQQQLAQMLFAQSRGQTPGAGELAVNRQANQALAQQTSAAQMARGANAAMAMRNAARNRADIGVNAAGQAAIAQLQDQQAAQNQLGSLLGQTRSQDLGAAQANQNAQLSQQNLQLSALAQMLGVDQAELGQSNLQTSLDMQAAQRRDAQLAAALQAGGTAAAAYAAGSGNKGTGANDPSNYWQGSTRQGSLYGR